jgi:hypothetical protein
MVKAAVPSCQAQEPSSHGVNIRIASPPSVFPYGFAPEGFATLSATATPFVVTGLFPPKTIHDPLATVIPAAQKVLDVTPIGEATLLVRE